MTDTEKQIDDKKGDEVLRRMLKTPPDPRTDGPKKPLPHGLRDGSPAATSGSSRGEAKD